MTFYEWKSKMAATQLFWKNWIYENNKLYHFFNSFGVKESKKYVILVIQGQGHHLRPSKGQHPPTTVKFWPIITKEGHNFKDFKI